MARDDDSSMKEYSDSSGRHDEWWLECHHPDALQLFLYHTRRNELCRISAGVRR